MSKETNKVVQPVSMKAGQDISGNKIPLGGNEATFGYNGYPNNIPNTQTQRTRGTKNTTRGNSHSKKMG